ncbi:MAG: sigma-70 family RNA polymerase sigma factor [Phycisphaerales bacterium]|nr:sigma-70 family RNA polymerase sigma factor [Phycisphaerales bacterium]
MAEDASSLIRHAASGDDDAARRLLPHIYDELRRLAAALLAGRGPQVTLQPTAIVHDAFLKLSGARADAGSPTHFRALAAVAIRQVIIDHARRRGRARHGGEHHRIALTDEVALTGSSTLDAEAVHKALAELAILDPRAARIVEFRFFGGLTETEIAAHLGISERTVRNDWTMARAWLRTALSGEAEP